MTNTAHRDVVIFGTGSFAELAHFYFTNDSDYRPIGFAATSDVVNGRKEFMGLPLVDFAKVEQIFSPARCAMFIAVGYAGMNRTRETFIAQALEKRYSLATYISSFATVWQREKIGRNCFIFEDNTIQPFTTIGDGSVLWSGNHVGHHSHIGDFCFLTSHVVISGHVRVGKRCFFGVNAAVRDDIVIGDDCMVGPGSLILKSTQPGEAYIAQRTPKFSKNSSFFFKAKR